MNTWHKLYKYSVKSAFYISVLGPDYMSQVIRAWLAELVSVWRDLGMFVKCNKSQLCDYTTTGPGQLVFFHMITRLRFTDIFKDVYFL